MEIILQFFGEHYILFTVLSVILLFGLIGYFVDQSDQKKGISKIIKYEQQKDLHDLAAQAEGKSLNSVVNKSMINPNANSTTDANGQNVSNTAAAGIDVLTK